jgi:YYY domain-containing protein
MLSFLSWYLLITFLGWLTFPLAYRLFPALTDRGYTLSRAFGLLVWGYVFWLFASFGIAQNDRGGLLLGLVVLGGLSAWSIASVTPIGGKRSEIVNWIRENRRVVITTEILFLVAFGAMATFRAANPEIIGTEKPMELMFISGIMNSPTFPPRDLWLSGYSISYYYFGYVMTSMLALFTGVPATVAFNLMIALIFGLSAVGAYGILYNLLTNPKYDVVNRKDLHNTNPGSGGRRQGVQVSSNNKISSFLFPLFGPLFLLLVSNVEGFLEVLHKRGLFWSGGKNFWTWLDMKELSEAPTLPFTWIPDRFWWWWRASRVIQDYDLNGNWTIDTIDEFPFFSYLLGDMHPHVLAMPFTLLAIAVALNLFLGGWRGKMNLYFAELHINKVGFFIITLVLGGLAFLNTWDILIAAALIVFSYALAQVHESGWGWERVEDVLLLGIPVALTAFVMYLPFYIGFDSQAGGILPNFMYPTRGAHFWVMWGTLFLPLFAFLIYLWRSGKAIDWRAGIFTALGILLTLLVAMFVIGFLALRLRPDMVNSVLQAQGLAVGDFIAASMARRLAYIGSLLTLMAVMVPTFSFLAKADDGTETVDNPIIRRPSSTIFILLLIALGSLLILGPDFVYLRDNFGFRINSVFKFYYQAWILLSLAAAYGTAILLKNLRGTANGIFSTLFAIVLIAGLTYPAISIFSKTNNFKPPFGYTLDDFDRMQRENPDEAAAMLWLRSAPDGVIVEATRPDDAYSAYSRISIYTGLPAVIGWGNHEGQWRDRALQGSRVQDIETLYTGSDWATTQDIINRYNIRYIFVGNLERSTYPVNEDKFSRFLKPVFQQGNVTIYEVP